MGLIHHMKLILYLQMFVVVNPILGLTFEEMKDSCKGMCGKHSFKFCSCDSRCVVYKTCCEDFQTDCPDVYQKGIEKYKDLLHLELYCTSYNVVMVASCPNTSATQTHLDSNQAVSLNNKENFSLFTYKNVLSFINNRPVTNTDTGIVFTNKIIYDCNNKNGSNFTFWQPFIGDGAWNFSMWKQHSHPVNLIAYTPPYHLSHATFCVNDVVDSCHNQTYVSLPLQDYNYSVKMCSDFISYIFIKKEYNENIAYRNRYCVVCNEGYGDFIKSGFKSHTTKFKILFHMNTNHSVQLTTKTVALNQHWQEAICDFDDFRTVTSLLDIQDSSCEIQKCSPEFFQSLDNKCHRFWIIGIADTTGGFITTEYKQLNASDVLICLLNEIFDFKVYKFLENQYIFKEESKENIVLELIQVYSIKNEIKYETENIEPEINKKIKIKLVSISAVIQNYKNNTRENINTEASSYVDVLTERNIFEKKVSVISQQNQLNGMFVFNRSVTVCIMMEQTPKGKRLCTPRSEHDLQAETQDIDKLLQSKCLMTNTCWGIDLMTLLMTNTVCVLMTLALID